MDGDGGAMNGRRTGTWALGTALLFTGAWGQAPQLVVSSGKSAARAVLQAEIVREIDDPHFGGRWLLLHDEDHPGGPGRLVPSANGQGSSEERSPGQNLFRTELVPVIHAGDRLVVEEHTAVADVRLAAVAMGPANTGATLAVRLSIGGRVARAVALAPGRAAFLPETVRAEVQP